MLNAPPPSMLHYLESDEKGKGGKVTKKISKEEASLAAKDLFQDTQELFPDMEKYATKEDVKQVDKKENKITALNSTSRVKNNVKKKTDRQEEDGSGQLNWALGFSEEYTRANNGTNSKSKRAKFEAVLEKTSMPDAAERVQSEDSRREEDEDEVIQFPGLCLPNLSKVMCGKESSRTCQAKNNELCSGQGSCSTENRQNECCNHLICPVNSVQPDHCQDGEDTEDCQDVFEANCLKQKLDKCPNGGNCVHFKGKEGKCCFHIACQTLIKQAANKTQILKGGGSMTVRVGVPSHCNRTLCPVLPDVCPKEGTCLVKAMKSDGDVIPRISCKVDVNCIDNTRHAFEIEYEFGADKSQLMIERKSSHLEDHNTSDEADSDFRHETSLEESRSKSDSLEKSSNVETSEVKITQRTESSSYSSLKRTDDKSTENILKSIMNLDKSKAESTESQTIESSTEMSENESRDKIEESVNIKLEGKSESQIEESSESSGGGPNIK